eukprot:6004082-Prorocentrum_lima.AAC.1
MPRSKRRFLKLIRKLRKARRQRTLIQRRHCKLYWKYIKLVEAIIQVQRVLATAAEAATEQQ